MPIQVTIFLSGTDVMYKKIVKSRCRLGYSAEMRVLYCKLGQFQKIREIAAGHLYQGLDQSTKGFLMFACLCSHPPVGISRNFCRGQAYSDPTQR